MRIARLNQLKTLACAAVAATAFASTPIAAPTLILDPATNSQNASAFQSALDSALDDFKGFMNYEFPSSVVIVVSDRPEFVAREYSNRRNADYGQKLRAFQQWIYGEATYGGVYYNLSNREFNNRADTTVQGNRIRSINHELFHILQYELVGNRARNCCVPNRVPSVGPQWLMEGSASYFARAIAREPMRNYISYSRRQISNLGGQSLEALETRVGLNEVQSSYEISAYAVHLLVEQNGVNSIFEFYQRLGRSGNWEAAFRESFGQTPDQFYASFR